MRPEYGETWVYESIVGALPGIDLSDRAAVALQFSLFQVGLLVLAAVYDLWTAVLAGTAAVVVAAAGSVVMLRMGAAIRSTSAPEPYRRLIFGSSVEVVLGVLAFIALVTHLFVFDPGTSEEPLIEAFFGPEPSMVAVYLMLLVLWDLCYRIGASWWTAVISLWRSYAYPTTPEAAVAFRRVDRLNIGFGLIQLLLVPFVLDRPVLLVAITGHVVAVTVVCSLSIVFAKRNRSDQEDFIRRN
ncbi:DUF7530 family protein [Natronorarus salvus]|uniref:DUF7530 family protein n=1 Tax=Natronorarus salvus TaxID=3117733 RepID=UPI002F26A679